MPGHGHTQHVRIGAEVDEDAGGSIAAWLTVSRKAMTDQGMSISLFATTLQDLIPGSTLETREVNGAMHFMLYRGKHSVDGSAEEIDPDAVAVLPPGNE